MWNGVKTGVVLIGVDLLLLLFLFWFILTWTSIHVFREWWKSRKNEVKKIPSLSGMLLLALLSSSWITGCTRIAPGYVGIKVSAQSAPNISGMSIDQFPEIECAN